METYVRMKKSHITLSFRFRSGEETCQGQDIFECMPICPDVC